MKYKTKLIVVIVSFNYIVCSKFKKIYKLCGEGIFVILNVFQNE